MSSETKELADRLGISPRRVKMLEADGVISPWLDLDENFERYRTVVDCDTASIVRQLEAAALAADRGLEKLRSTKTLAGRRALAETVGPCAGRLANALALHRAIAPPESRQLLLDYENALCGRWIDEFFELLNLRIEDPA